MNEATTLTKTAETPRDEATLLPPTDVIEDSEGITLYADLPGVPKDQIDLHVDGDTLTVEGPIALDVPDGMASTHAEVGVSRYRRVFTLSRELDANRIGAEFNGGVLKLRIPKAEHAQPRRIAIQTH